MVFSTINVKHWDNERWDNNTNTGNVPAYLCTLKTWNPSRSKKWNETDKKGYVNILFISI